MENGHASSTNEWVTLIKSLRPSAENLSAIKSGMEKTYTRCRVWITKDSPTVSDQQVPTVFGHAKSGKRSDLYTDWVPCVNMNGKQGPRSPEDSLTSRYKHCVNRT